MPKTITLDLPEKYWEPLRVVGVIRDAENPKALVLYLSREYSDNEMRELHEAIRKPLSGHSHIQGEG